MIKNFFLKSIVLSLLSIVLLGGNMLQANTAKEPLYVALIWNQHQPLYKDPLSSAYQQPWVRLHGVKDYYQMAAWLKQYPSLHQTFNLTPALILQIQDYAQGCLDSYALLSEIEPEKLSLQDEAFITSHFFSVPRVARRGRILELEQKVQHKEALNRQEIFDLQVLFNLAWIDPSLVAAEPYLSALQAQDRNFSYADKVYILNYHKKIMREILPLHKELAERGVIELITTPFYHPILPLLINSAVAAECTPDCLLPSVVFAHPEDAVVQVQKALDFHKEIFGEAPRGLWPSEEAVSAATVELLAEQGVQWIVTDETILSRTLRLPLRGKAVSRTAEEGTQLYVPGTAGSELLHPEILYQPYTVEVGGRSLTVLFRDEYLSDLIGFEYARYSGKQAAYDLLARLKHIKKLSKGKQAWLVTLALDGENAWEFYPEEKTIFLRTLYAGLSKNPELKLVSVSEYLKKHSPARTLKTLATGSWNMGNLERWIGSPSKNKVWELLYRVREELTKLQDNVTPQQKAQAWEEFYAAQGSDYPWWLDSQPGSQALPFEKLFRLHLVNVYRALGQEVPEFLQAQIIK
jgi:alpha-amylase/alpha-mannosidase (GH57 family)